MKIRISSFFLLAFAFAGSQSASAQVTTATFHGIVNDPTRAVVPGATVTLVNEETAASATKTADAAGEFTFEFLRVGSYTLTIQAGGFKLFRSSGIQLAAAQNVRQTFVLEVGAVSDTLEVRGEAIMLNTVAADQRESHALLELDNLPTAQRNFAALLNIGTAMQTTADGGVRMNGLGRSGLKVTVDGTDASSNAENPSTSLKNNFNYIQVMSMEAIGEVQTTKGVTAAEYGFQLSGNVNLIVKSGTNQWHGSLFENFKDQYLNARDRTLGRRPTFNFNQFGGSGGGPIVKNRIFVFGTYEGYRQKSFGVIQGDVPTQGLRSQAIAAVPAYKPFLDSLYLPNQPLASPNALTGRYTGAGRESRSDNHVDLKGDVRLGNAGNLGLTYSRGRPFYFTPNGSIQTVNSRTYNGWQQRGTASFVTGGSSWSSETRFGYNYSETSRVDGYWNVIAPNGEITPGGRRAASLAVSGLFGNGGGTEDINPSGSLWTLEEKYAKRVGQHSIKFGAIYENRAAGRYDIQNVTFAYANLSDFLANIPNSVAAVFGANRFLNRAHEIGGFAQDDWRIKPNLVFNLGIRYDSFSKFVAHATDPKNPAALYNLDGLLDRQFHFGALRDTENPVEPDGWVNLGPRFGFAYSLGRQANTVIRGGFGVMFTPQTMDNYDRAVATSANLPMRKTFSRTEAIRFGLGFPQYNDDLRPLVSGSSVLQIGQVFDPHIQAPYAMQTSFGIQRNLTSRLMLETAYVGTLGRKFTLERFYNLPDRITDIRPNPEMAEGRYDCSCQNTSFNSWQTSVRQQFWKHLLFNAHYTWSKTLAPTGGDTGSDFSGDSTASIQDFFDVRSNRGPTPGSTTHRFVMDWVYELPTKLNLGNGVLNRLFGGWGVSGIVNAQTGMPVYISQTGLYSRPDYVGGNPINPNYMHDGIYLNRSAFKLVPLGAGGNPSRPGTLGNDAIRAPGSWGIDAGLGKTFAITERIGLRLRAEAFNLLNHTPYSGFTAGINSANFGKFTGFAAPRQVQLNARLTW